jgi:hypothetical protein
MRLGQQRLADGVVDLVRAGVVQVLALQEDLRAADSRLSRAAWYTGLGRPTKCASSCRNSATNSGSSR